MLIARITYTWCGGSPGTRNYGGNRFGLRAFGTDQNARLTINGKVTKLVGWNHHTQW